MSKGFALMAGALGVAALLGGCGPGAVSPTVQTGRADVNEAGDRGSISTGDWTYGLPTSGVSWVDRQGTRHDSGRPECLAPGTSTNVKFAAVEVRVGDATWRPVVWISCQ